MSNLSTVSRSTKVFLFAVSLFIFIAGCNPAVYKKPAEDFHAATVCLKQTYFLEWELSNKARIQRGDLEDQIGIWTAPGSVDKSMIQRVADRMKERQQEDIHKNLRPLREEAFAVIEGYAEIIVNLASDEPTEVIVSEINGLTKDIDETLKAASKMKALVEYSDKITNFTGPLQQYANILTEIARLVSSAVRERAIVQTIGKSNDSIIELMSVLKEEAVAAHENAQSQIKGARNELELFLGNPGLANTDNAIKAAVAKRIADLDTLEKQIEDDEIDSVFDSAIKAQGALVKKALLRDAKDWAEQIRVFKNKVAAAEEAIEKVMSEM